MSVRRIDQDHTRFRSIVRGRIKLEIGLAKGKKQHDKRADALDKDSKREAQRAMKERLH